MSLLSSFMLWAIAFFTTPVTSTVCPTCFASDSLLLRTSQVLPSFAAKLNSLALSPCDKHPVMVRVSDFPFASAESSAITHTDAIHASTMHKNRFLIIGPPVDYLISRRFDSAKPEWVAGEMADLCRWGCIPFRLRFATPLLRILLVHFLHCFCGFGMITRNVLHHLLHHFIPRFSRQILITRPAQLFACHSFHAF